MNLTESIYVRREGQLHLGGHAEYRVHCSRQLASTRKRLGRSTPKNGKYQKKESITAEDVKRNNEFVQILLLSSERAWAHAMDMKSAHADDNNEKGASGSARSHIISRLTKAAKQARELADLLVHDKSSSTNTDWLEATAYAHVLMGTVEFEKHASSSKSSDSEKQRRTWSPCLTNFSAARLIYSTILQAKRTDAVKDVLAGTVDPSIRFAAYQSNISRTVPVIKIAEEYFPKDEKKLAAAIKQLDEASADGKADDSSIPNTITWRKREANIVDASIGQALAHVSTAEEHLTTFFETKKETASVEEIAGAYDEVLIASQDAADAARHAIDDHKKEGISEGDPRMQDLRITSLAINYDLVGWRVGRNRVLIGSDDGADLSISTTGKRKRPKKEPVAEKPREEGPGRRLARLRERVVLYDAILQSIDSVKDLPGAAEPSFSEELDGRRAYFQSLKCLNIAYSHGLLSSSKEALALLLRAQSLSSKALSATYLPTPSSTIPKLDVSKPDMEALDKKLRGLVTHYRAKVELANLQSHAREASKKNSASTLPLVDRLLDYPAAGVDLKNLVTWPPALQAIPVKPLFFDLAWNYIEYPGRGLSVTKSVAGNTAVGKAAGSETEADKTAEKKGGWGWFGR